MPSGYHKSVRNILLKIWWCHLLLCNMSCYRCASVTVHCERVLVVSFVAAQYELFLVVSFSITLSLVVAFVTVWHELFLVGSLVNVQYGSITYYWAV